MLEIKTPYGYMPFLKIVNKGISPILRIETNTGKKLRCSTIHKLIDEQGNIVLAKDVCVGEKLKTEDGIEPVHRIINEDAEEVFDFVNVGDNHVFYTNGILSHNCSFMGSSNTLLSGDTLQRLTFKTPIAYDYNERMRIYEHPVPGNYYVMAVDVAEGTGGDYSVVCVIDVTTMPYRQVAIYQHNLIQPIPFTQIVHDIGKRYNDAYAIVENNSIGKIVADSLFFDFEYESIFCTGQMFDAQNLGVRTTKKVKALGCSNLKAMIEGNRLLITDFSTVSELSTFSATRTGSYAAEKGKHDDTVMPLVIFAYVTSLDYFQDITNIDFRSNIRQAFEESDNLSCMFVDDGLSDYE